MTKSLAASRPRNIASLLEGLRLVAHNVQLQFLAYLINIALEEANNEKAIPDEGASLAFDERDELLAVAL